MIHSYCRSCTNLGLCAARQACVRERAASALPFSPASPSLRLDIAGAMVVAAALGLIVGPVLWMLP